MICQVHEETKNNIGILKEKSEPKNYLRSNFFPHKVSWSTFMKVRKYYNRDSGEFIPEVAAQPADETLYVNIEDGVNELRALGVVALGPIVAGARLAEDKVVGSVFEHEQMFNETSSYLNSAPYSLPRMASIVPGSKSTKTARGTYLLFPASL